MTPGKRGEATRGERGFTLIELLVSLAIFALISLAGAQLIQTLIGVQGGTERRGDRLSEVQRGLFLVSADFEQLSAGPELAEGAVAFTRGGRAGDYPVAYRFAQGALLRTVGGADQALVTGLDGATIRFLKNGAWQTAPVTDDDKTRPRAVEIVLDLAVRPGVTGGPVRRVIELPAEP